MALFIGSATRFPPASKVESPQPATEQLLKRAQRFCKRGLLYELVKKPAEIRFPGSRGFPELIHINQEFLTEWLTEKARTVSQLQQELEWVSRDDMVALDLGQFIHLAQYLELSDFNQLVGLPGREA